MKKIQEVRNTTSAKKENEKKEKKDCKGKAESESLTFEPPPLCSHAVTRRAPVEVHG